MPKNILTVEQQKDYDLMLEKKESIKFWWFTKDMSYVDIGIELDNFKETECIDWKLISYFIELELY